jgi:hypothetical protein
MRIAILVDFIDSEVVPDFIELIELLNVIVERASNGLVGLIERKVSTDGKSEDYVVCPSPPNSDPLFGHDCDQRIKEALPLEDSLPNPLSNKTKVFENLDGPAHLSLREKRPSEA